MAEQNQPLSAEQVLEDIKKEITTPVDMQEPYLIQLIDKTRKMQKQFRITPVLGALIGLKKVFYQLNHSAFSQQFNINDSLLKLIEELYSEVHQIQTTQNHKVAALQHQLTAVLQVVNGQKADMPSITTSLSSNPAVITNSGNNPLGLSKIYTVPAEMQIQERTLLYSLIYSLRPHYCLEIGTFRGGSALLICAALDDTGYGQLVCVDPEPRLTDETWQQIKHRAIIVAGPSPAILPKAAEASPDKFDFALIDGDHSYEGALADIEGTLPLLADRAYLIFHDSHYFEVKDAINQALEKYSQELIDCGELSTLENHQTDEWGQVEGRQVIWGGLRLLRFNRK
jgi:cephalosporin hydroxylase